jgi:5'-phosphate synthase pdxT subunit
LNDSFPGIPPALPADEDLSPAAPPPVEKAGPVAPDFAFPPPPEPPAVNCLLPPLEDWIREDPPLVGVLAIQGNFASHIEALTEAGARAVEVRKPEELENLDGLVLPGGESTTVLRFLEKRHFFAALQEFCRRHAVFGTCAGAILLAREVRNPAQQSLGLLDAVVERNAYGRQIDSTILTAETALPGGPLEMVFIRAPRFLEVGAGVEVLARREGYPVLIQQGKHLAATFHPELTADRRVHRRFVEIVQCFRQK